MPRRVPSHLNIIIPFIAILIAGILTTELFYHAPRLNKINWTGLAIIIIILGIATTPIIFAQNNNALKDASQYLINAPANTNIHIPHHNLWTMRYYFGELPGCMFCSFNGRNTLERSSPLNISFDERLSIQDFKKGDWIIVTGGNESWEILDNLPLANNLLFYEKQFQHYSPEVLKFIRANSRLLLGRQRGDKTTFQIYEITSNNKEYNPQPFERSAIVKKVCAMNLPFNQIYKTECD